MAGYSTTLRNGTLNAITTAVGNAGILSIYDGVQPATGGAATTLLAQFTLGTPFAAGAAAAVLSPTLPAATVGLANSTATWARITTSGAAFVADITAGTGGTELILNTAVISVGLNVSITAWTVNAGNP